MARHAHHGFQVLDVVDGAHEEHQCRQREQRGKLRQ